MGTVYICHHIDTEGPLWENIEDLFGRLKLIFNIDLKPTYGNLVALQKDEIDLPQQQKDELRMVVDPHTVNYKRNWGMIEEMLGRIMKSDYRNALMDSYGGGWIFNWHVMDHVGFGETNPRHRDYGFHNVFDFYKYMINVNNSSQDRIHWHFHPISFYKHAHIPATSYDNSMSILHQVISRRLIDKNWFPVVNRAGFHSERIDSNFFLEQWIPFDPSNQAVDDIDQPRFQKDLSNGRFGDWRGAPTDWSIYHPSLYDWRQKGEANRVIARALNMKSRHRNITDKEVDNAFRKAAVGDNVYLGVTNHDWREMSTEIDEFRKILSTVSKRYPDVKFKFSESVEAFRNVLQYSTKEVIDNELDLEFSIDGNILNVKVRNGEIFGPQPYLALKTKNGDYFHDNFDFHDYKKSFSYALDDYTIPISNLQCAVVASNDKYGNTCIRRLNF